jgi:hypothetical protein
MSGKALATQLRRFDIRSAGMIRLRPHGPLARGYRRDAFEDAFARYAVLDPPKRYEANESGPETPISKRYEPSTSIALSSATEPENTESSCALAHSDTDHEREPEEDDDAPDGLI